MAIQNGSGRGKDIDPQLDLLPPSENSSSDVAPTANGSSRNTATANKSLGET